MRASALGLLLGCLLFGQPVRPAVAAQRDQDRKSPPRTLSLAGEWRYLRDEQDAGVRDRVWEVALPDVIRVPGVLSSKTHLPEATEADGTPYEGVAWFQREITIPYSWRRRHITLFLERCGGETRVWVDRTFLGARASLSTPHVYDITRVAAPGSHRLTIRVDGRPRQRGGQPVAAPGWTGMLGRIELRGTARVWIEDVQIFPDVGAKRMRVRVQMGNVTGAAARVRVNHEVVTDDSSVPLLGFVTSGSAEPGMTWLENSVALPSAVKPWTVHAPHTYTFRSSSSATDGRTTWVSVNTVTFGVRDVAAGNGSILLNGSPVLLRGTVLRPTAVPPETQLMNRASWDRTMREARTFGLNHLRFAGWCPPECAFEAADRAGVALLIEVPPDRMVLGRDPGAVRGIIEEGQAIARCYGNHPSFVLMTMGNGLEGDVALAEDIVKAMRSADPRRLYAASSGGVVTDADAFRLVRVPLSASTEPSGEASGVPILAHELGGADAESIASGDEVSAHSSTTNGLVTREKLEAIRACVERMLAARALAGFHLDLPLLGGGPTPQDAVSAATEATNMRRWCNDTVLVAAFSSRVLATTDLLRAAITVVHFGPAPLPSARVRWQLLDDVNKVLATGTLSLDHVAVGNADMIGTVEVALRDVPTPARLRFRAELEGTDLANEWTVYVYSPVDEGAFAEGVYVTRRFTRDVLARLERGAKVVLIADVATLRRSMPAVLVFDHRERGPAGIEGIRCDPGHPSLREFPSESWADVQWHDVLRRSRYFLLPSDAWAQGVLIAPVLEGYSSLPCLVMECRVGHGKLLLCSLDLVTESERRHEARQLLKSLLDYAASDQFRPVPEISPAALAMLLRLEGSDDTYAGLPPDRANASLWVRCGGLKQDAEGTTWRPDLDIVLVRDEGVQYEAQATVTGQGTDAGWTGKREIAIALTLPPSAAESVWLRLAGDDDSVLQVSAGRTTTETIKLSAGRATWVRFHLSDIDWKDGTLRIRVGAERGRWKLLDLVLVRPH